MTMQEFEKLCTFYAKSTILSEQTKQAMISNLYQVANRTEMEM